MHYFIDAYNLLFRTHDPDVELQKQRDQLISGLAQKAVDLELDLTLVFDSSYQPGEATRGHVHAIEIIYTAEGESADRYILNSLEVKRKGRQQTVVTSDKVLADSCRQLGAKTLSVESFLLWIHARYRNQFKKQTKRAALPPLRPKTLSSPTRSAEDQYLELFEKRYEELERTQESPAQQSSRDKPIKSKRKSVVRKESHESDHDRWLRIFEEKL